MAGQLERPLWVLVVLVALLVISQTTVSPRNRLLGTVGLVVGGVSIGYALAEMSPFR